MQFHSVTRAVGARHTGSRLAVVAGAVLLSGCSAASVGSTGGQVAGNPTSTPAAATATAGPATIALTSADRAAAVPLDNPVTVKSSGSLDYVSVTPAGGAPLAGTMDPTSHTWTATGGLEPSTTYTVKAQAHSDAGQVATQATFATVAAKRLTTSPIPADGATVGVAMPLKLTFNSPVAADKQAELVHRITVTSTPSVPGAWHWYSPTEVHYRPAELWPAHTQVSVQANLQGLNAGNGYWGLANWSEHFTIGDKHVSQIDNNTHQMTVSNNDVPQWQWPVSLGTTSRPTISGVLVIWYHQQDVLMDSLSLSPPIPRTAPNGYYEHVYWDTAISTDGFFVHAAPWSAAQQGVSNVSHGCVNLTTARAQQFYDWSLVGDVVIITNTGRAADAGDGEGDWQIPFAQYPNSQGVTADSTVASNPGGV